MLAGGGWTQQLVTKNQTMLLNYLKLAVRLLIRNPFFTFVNIVGLAIGLTSFFALWQYSSTELKVDQYHKDSDRIVRICGSLRWTPADGTAQQISFGFSFLAYSI